MTPKEKAKQIIDGLWNTYPLYKNGQKDKDLSIAKNQSHLMVDQMINMAKLYDNHNVAVNNKKYTELCVSFWLEVRNEIYNYV